MSLEKSEYPHIQQRSNLLLIGLGNEFRHDDGVGIYMIRKLQEKTLPSHVRVMTHHAQGIDLIEAWKDFHRVILFDAVHSGKRPGTIHCFEIPDETIAGDVFGHSTHAFSIVEVLALAKALEQLPKRLTIYGIEGKLFEVGIGLSPEVASAAQNILTKVRKTFHL